MLLATAALTLLGAAIVLAFRVHGPVAVLIVEESNGSILSGRPESVAPRLGLETRGAATGEGTAAVHLDPALLPLPRTTRLLVYQAVTSGVDLVGDRFWPLDSFPCAVETGTALVPYGATADEGGGPYLVRNEQRLGPPAVEVLDLTSRGTLRLRLRGTDLVLEPGEQWVEGRTVRAGSERTIPADTWEQEVEAALEAGVPLTVTRISYLGLVPRSRIGPLP